VNHLLEWSASQVDEALTRLNVLSLEGTRPYDYLFYGNDVPRRNDGRLSSPTLQRYRHIEAGGWWCSGINLLTGDDDLWGCFKPDQPRTQAAQTPEKASKPIKYEHPPKTRTGVFALRVPLHLWQAIADRAGIPLSHKAIDESKSDFGFWQWILDHPEIPLCITEGAKKAGTLLSAGYAAIALPGINGGYRVERDQWGQRRGKSRLIPQLQRLSQGDRPMYLVFDRDRKPSTVKAVNTALQRTGYLLNQAGCPVHIVTWNPDQGKGVDDFIAQHGVEAFAEAFNSALPLNTWKAQILNALTVTPSIELQQRYLGAIAIPEDQPLVAIHSPKGTGKTELLNHLVQQAKARQQKVLVVGHRVQLIEALCQRFELPYVSQLAQPRHPDVGMGLCIDSLHPDSQAQFDPDYWQNALVILDEVEQVLWHGLNSDTCRSQRVAVLRSLKRLMENTLGHQGQVIVADADLSDMALEYLSTLAGVETEPFLIANPWKPTAEESWQVHHYSDSTPKRFVKDLETYIEKGGKPFVCLSAQKLTSRWGTRSLEAYFSQKFPDHRILRIDAESVADPKHPAYHCTRHLNHCLKDYDLVLASPAIETGVSIDEVGVFTSVWAIAQGVQSANTVRQAMARVRDAVPRYLWAAPYGFNKVGNGSTSISGLLTSGKRLTQLNVRLLQQADFEALDELDVGFQAESLRCWAKMGVRLNAAMANYRNTIVAALAAEGHQICPVTPGKRRSRSRKAPKSASDTLHDRIAEVQQQNYQQECAAIVNAPELTEQEYRASKKRLVKRSSDRRALRKYELHRRYKVPVTEALVQQDDHGAYQKLRLHYFLTVGRSFLRDRDRRIVQQLIEQGQGQVFQPDFNRSQLGATIGTMHLLGIHKFLETPERELSNNDPDLQKLAEIALKYRQDIKTTTGIGLAKNSTPMVILRRFLDKIGYGLTCLRCQRRHKKVLRIYRLDVPQDDRLLIFRNWLAIDQRIPGRCDRGVAIPEPQIPTRKVEDDGCIQLSLDLD
jgi:DNA primase